MKDLIKGKTLRASELLELIKGNCKNFIYKAPIDLKSILECLEIKLKKVNNWNDILGEIEVKNQQTIITINEANHLYPNRERFTIAHEIGHLCRHIAPLAKETTFKDTEKTLKRNNLWDIKEYEANNFADQFLMPDDLIVKEGKKIALNLKEKGDIELNEFIIEMAQIFDVPTQIMKFRLSSLRVI